MTASIRNNLLAVNASLHLKAHYNELATSVRRLSTGLRVERAADDAAGLAIRELMRADVATLHQGARNANDAVSLIQTADGALQIIDEKLIRMKELAEQAATGTYDSTQRLIIDSEFQQMASEIDRIAKATEFNGVKLLDGSLSGRHDGSGAGSEDGLSSTGALKVHFGTANDSAEDYYYVEIGDATLAGLGLRDGVAGGAGAAGGINGVPILGNKIPNGQWVNDLTSGYISFGIIPAGTTNLRIEIDDWGFDDDIVIFDRTGKILSGTLYSWRLEDVVTEDNGFLPNANFDASQRNGTGQDVNFVDGNTLHQFTVDGMNFGYTGSDPSTNDLTRNRTEVMTIDEVKEDLILVIAGAGKFNIKANWTAMPGTGGFVPGDPNGDIISIKTQQLDSVVKLKVCYNLFTYNEERPYGGTSEA